MPQLNTNLVVANDIEKDGEYKILDVADFKSPKGDKGLKVTMNSLNEKDKKVYSTILWTRENAGINSKLGAFIIALAEVNLETGKVVSNNTDDWIGAQIRVIEWEERKRKIEVIA